MIAAKVYYMIDFFRRNGVSVKIRLTRMGTKKKPHYRVVVVDSRKKRDGAYIENVGVYHLVRQGSTSITYSEGPSE